MDFDRCKREFDRYTSNFDMNNDMINRKYYHTYRVAEYSEQISKAENLSENDIELAKVCALLHDIARFRQATEYETFNDLISFDHGDKGYEILLENNYISNYLEDKEEQDICLKAIKNHNKYVIEDNLTERELYFTKLVRDSDKLDIMDTQRNIVNDGEKEIFLPVLQAFRKNELYKKNYKLNIVSIILMQICFIFDLNFKKSFEILENKKIIERKIVILRENCDKTIVDEIENTVFSYINSII